MKNGEMNSSDVNSTRVEAHYSQQDLGASLLRALIEAGKDPDHLTAEDLAPVDQFHIRGRQATLKLAQEISLNDGMRVLDIGSGLGGAARHLALEFGCQVTGLDLSADYCRAAAMLTRRLGLDSRICFRQGSALDMPFAEGTFDALWMQHAGMNIPAKELLCREMWRVLKPGGVLALYEIFAGAGGPVHFPVPWAREASISFLSTPQQMRATLEAVGFETVLWRDVTETCRSWFRHLGEKMRRQGSPSLGIHLLLGPDFRVMAENQVRNLEEDRITLIEAVLRRPESPHGI